MSNKYIITEVVNHILVISINRADKMNALNAALLQEIKAEVLTAQNDKNVHGIILTGVGDKAFAAGADIAEFASFSKLEGEKLSADGHEVMNAIENSTKIVVAAVNGFALGGGCELAMACHIRVASENARFGQPEVNLGLLPGYGGTQRLVQLIGKAKAIEYLTTADLIKATEAHQLGLVNYVVEQSELMNTCTALIQKIAQKSPQAVNLTLQCVNAYFNNDENGFQKEITLFGQSFETEEFKEGVDAFLTKRKAQFRL
ncbi:MAG: enoyl-CoA hydratase [Bacteroidia bacterium]|jgi:enoyl-CoA hydratase